MRGLYITLINLLQPGNLGVTKVRGQINAFQKLGCEVDWIYEKNNNIFIENKYIGKRSMNYIGVNNFFIKIKQFLKQNKNTYDFVYIRYMPSNLGLLYLLKYLKKRNIKVFLEIPTYPYYPEMQKNVKSIIYKKIDQFITMRLKKYVFKIILTTEVDLLFGIDTITINNSIDPDIITFNEKKVHSTINLMGLANIQRWHGYDKVIQALDHYYKSKKCTEIVKFYIVGAGNEGVINQLKNAVEVYGLEEYVIFCGPKVASELDDIYSIMDIGISSLALDRAGGGHNPVKTKEYLGKGLPVIIGYEDKLLNNEIPFVFNILSNDNQLDILEVIDWYKSLQITSKEIREFACRNLSWKSEMSKIINSLEAKDE